MVVSTIPQEPMIYLWVLFNCWTHTKMLLALVTHTNILFALVIHTNILLALVTHTNILFALVIHTNILLALATHTKNLFALVTHTKILLAWRPNGLYTEISKTVNTMIPVTKWYTFLNENDVTGTCPKKKPNKTNIKYRVWKLCNGYNVTTIKYKVTTLCNKNNKTNIM